MINYSWLHVRMLCCYMEPGTFTCSTAISFLLRAVQWGDAKWCEKRSWNGNLLQLLPFDPLEKCIPLLQRYLRAMPALLAFVLSCYKSLRVTFRCLTATMGHDGSIMSRMGMMLLQHEFVLF